MEAKLSAAACIIKNSDSLDYSVGLVQRTDETDRLWGFPAGSVEPGETPEECVLRELLEETGYEGRILGLRCIIHWDDSSGHHIGYVFNVELVRRVSDNPEYLFMFFTHTQFLMMLNTNVYKVPVHIAGLYTENGNEVRL